MFKFTSRVLIFTILSIACTSSFAINVSVQSPSQGVSALGFQVNGQKYGAAGRFYSKNNMPAGTYQFGVRVNGLFGEDVGCAVAKLTKNTTVIVRYDGKRCVASIYSK